MCTALLLNEIYLPIKFQANSFCSIRVMLRTKFKYGNQQRGITQKLQNAELWFLCTALLINEIYLPIKFQANSFCSIRVMLRTKFKYGNQQRGITQKLQNAELWFLCTALLINEIYPPMKFQANSSCSIRLMLRTKNKFENQQRGITQKLGSAE